MPYPDKGRRILDGDATPDMARSWRVSVPAFQVVAHESAAFGENLIHMPVSLFHHVEYTVNVTPRYSLVEQVAHGVNEYLTGAAPTKRLYQTFLAQCQVKPHLEVMTSNPTETLGKPLRIAVVASAGDFGAPSNGIPSRVGPFDGRSLGHEDSPSRIEF